MSAHDLRCLAGIDTGHVERYYTRWLGQDTDPPKTITVDYLRVAREGKPPYTDDTTLALGSAVRDRAGAGGLAEADTYDDVEGPVRPSVVNEAIAMDLSCARDHKWRIVSMAIERQECDCLNQVLVSLCTIEHLRHTLHRLHKRVSCRRSYTLKAFSFIYVALHAPHPPARFPPTTRRSTSSLGCTGYGRAREETWTT